MATESPVTASIVRVAVQDTPADSAGGAVAQGIDFLSRGLLLDSLSWRKIGFTVIVLLSVWLLRRVLQRVVQRTVEGG